MSTVRAHVLGIARRDDAVLVSELTDPATGERFYRPPGGGIEFGESSEEAVVREFREEMDVEVESVAYLGTVENRFEFGGDPGHELAVVHEVAFDDDAHYEQESFDGIEGNGTTFVATWEPLDELVAGDQPLYPEGVERVLRGETAHLVS